MNAYKLVYFGMRTELRLPAIQSWYNPKTGVPYEGAFINGPLHNYLAAGGVKHKKTKGQTTELQVISHKWGPPTWQDEDAGIDRDHYGLQQPGQMPGAEEDDMAKIPAPPAQPHSGELQELEETPHKGDEERPVMYSGEIPQQPQFGPGPTIIIQAPVAPVAPGAPSSLPSPGSQHQVIHSPFLYAGRKG